VPRSARSLLSETLAISPPPSDFEKDSAAICRWPERIFQSGTSEIKTWIVLAGAMEQTALQMRLIDYVTCYRSLAGTGVGAGFAEWV
jgi:3-O-methylgallate 3,4-dioxygenase